MMNADTAENVQVKGDVAVRLYSKNGELLQSQDFHNLITTVGREFLTRKIVSDPEVISAIEIGTGTTAAQLTDTALEASVLSRDIRFESTENNIASFISTFEEDAPATSTVVSEVGLLTDQNLLVCRAVLDTSFTKQTTDYLVINWKIQIGGDGGNLSSPYIQSGYVQSGYV